MYDPITPWNRFNLSFNFNDVPFVIIKVYCTADSVPFGNDGDEFEIHRYVCVYVCMYVSPITGAAK